MIPRSVTFNLLPALSLSYPWASPTSVDTPHEQKEEHAHFAGEYLRAPNQRRPGFIFVPLLCKNLCSAPLSASSIGAVSLCLGPKGHFQFSFAILTSRPLQEVWALYKIRCEAWSSSRGWVKPRRASRSDFGHLSIWTHPLGAIPGTSQLKVRGHVGGTLSEQAELFKQHHMDAVMMLTAVFPHFILTQLNRAAASNAQTRKAVEQNPWRHALRVLITPFENDELWKHKPAQMCKRRPQWLHSLRLSSDSAARWRLLFYLQL